MGANAGVCPDCGHPSQWPFHYGFCRRVRGSRSSRGKDEQDRKV